MSVYVVHGDTCTLDVNSSMQVMGIEDLITSREEYWPNCINAWKTVRRILVWSWNKDNKCSFPPFSFTGYQPKDMYTYVTYEFPFPSVSILEGLLVG